jgi:hypothetical protein
MNDHDYFVCNNIFSQCYHDKQLNRHERVMICAFLGTVDVAKPGCGRNKLTIYPGYFAQLRAARKAMAAKNPVIPQSPPACDGD